MFGICSNGAGSDYMFGDHSLRGLDVRLGCLQLPVELTVPTHSQANHQAAMFSSINDSLTRATPGFEYPTYFSLLFPPISIQRQIHVGPGRGYLSQ